MKAVQKDSFSFVSFWIFCYVVCTKRMEASMSQLERWQKERLLEEMVKSALSGDKTVLILIRDTMGELGLTDLRDFSISMNTLREWQLFWTKKA